MPITTDIHKWKHRPLQQFWAEDARDEHLVQVYDNHTIFLNTLEGYAGSGLMAKESVVVVASAKNLSRLSERLTSQGFDLEKLAKKGRYLALDARQTLEQICINGSPDKKKFNRTIGTIYRKAAAGGTWVRAFGEMVVLLCEDKKYLQALELEEMWNSFMQRHPLTLFCAYPRAVFENGSRNIQHGVCCSHAKLIAGWQHPSTEVHFKSSSDQAAHAL